MKTHIKDAISELTERQKEVFKISIEYFLKSKKGIPYDIIANSLHISKNTAYDLLNTLTFKNFLKKEYFKTKKGVGRKKVLFIPKINIKKFVKSIEDYFNPLNLKLFFDELQKNFKFLSYEEKIEIVDIIKNNLNEILKSV